jgi:DNA invertase Pin-like site-specific DNA recombinase
MKSVTRILRPRGSVTATRPKSTEALAPRAFSYIRFSPKKQQKGESFRRRAEFAVEVCRENGWVLDDTLTRSDLGMSAFRGANAKVGALAEFREAIRIGRVLRGSVPIIESINRLSRNKVGEALQLLISILNSGVSIRRVQKPCPSGNGHRDRGLIVVRAMGGCLKTGRARMEARAAESNRRPGAGERGSQRTVTANPHQ